MADAVLRVAVGNDDVDEVSGLLWGSRPVAITELPGELLAGYQDRAAAGAALDSLEGHWPAAVEDPPEPEGWRDAWKAFAEPVVVGRVTVVPAWLPPVEGDLVIELDPGHAFGSGSHPTTRLALAALQDEVRSGDAVVDLGCGSGILAVAAARLGAGRVVGIDIDPEALRATTENAARNEVVIEAMAEPHGTFDLVVANIGAATLRSLAASVSQLAPRLLLTGILAGVEGEVIAAYPGHDVTAVDEDEGWVLVRLVRVDPDADAP